MHSTYHGHCRVYTSTCRATAGPTEDPAEHVYPTQKLLQDLQRILQSMHSTYHDHCRFYTSTCRATAGPTEDPAEHTLHPQKISRATWEDSVALYIVLYTLM